MVTSVEISLTQLCSCPLPQRGSVWWKVSLGGLFLFVFAVVALSGPGRIDIDDGQARYEVARSLVDHGDSAIRNPHVWYAVYPGREGKLFTTYRFPQSVAAVPAILLADATGPVAEPRRHFFFTLIGAVATGLLAVVYAVWFGNLGHSPRSALLWAVGGIFCTPNWYYGTSSFDDILCALVLVCAVAIAWCGRRRWPLRAAAGAGLSLGLLFNCKQPLDVFVLPILVLLYDPQLPWRRQWGRAAWVFAGLAAGVLAYKGYDWWKFPPETLALRAELMKKDPVVFGGNPVAALLGLSISPGAGALWYCPALILCFRGLWVWWPVEKAFCRAILVASVVFVLFISTLTFFKGDMSWGPRYLTSLVALLWIFVPSAAATLRLRLVSLVLTMGFLVQLAGLSVDLHRLYALRGLRSGVVYSHPWMYFDPTLAHLANRPREIFEILTPHEPAEKFTPAPGPTVALPVLDFYESGREALRAYHVLNSFRPWWISQQYLAPADRPVDLARTVWLLTGCAGVGLALMSWAFARGTGLDRSKTDPHPVAVQPSLSLSS
jgi:hypothetical protein